jgi:tetratricopeptide (TPR) repeat protein
MTIRSDNLDNENVPTEIQISNLGAWIDESCDSQCREKLIEAIRVGNQLRAMVEDRKSQAIIHFYLANAHAGLREISRKENVVNQLLWEDKDLEKELVNLRLAHSICQQIPISKIGTDLPFRVATNLGNALNHIGRISEAIELWDLVLLKWPSFGMAEGNRGYGLFCYSGTLYDQGHRIILLSEARKALKKALNQKLEGDARKGFESTLNDINFALNEGPDVLLKEFPLGKSRLERDYRAWVLSNRLFVNPLNDLGNQSIAAFDVLTIPSMVASKSGQPPEFGLFNQMKQEFVSARFLLFEGIIGGKRKFHFSDREVLLYNTFDFPVYSLNIEKVKLAFVYAYSVLDKVAFLINQYFKLGIPENCISFRKVWYTKNGASRKLCPKFSTSLNWPLRGLFWLSKDLYEENAKFKDSIEPDAKELCAIRNHIAHKFLKVHDDFHWRKKDSASDLFFDKLSFSITRVDLCRKTIKLLKLVRCALIYCTIAIQFEEVAKQRKRVEAKVFPMSLDVVEDRFKI